MPQDNRQMARTNNQAPVTQQQNQELTPAEKISKLGNIIQGRQEQIETLLAGRATFDQFKAVVIMAVTKNSDLLDCSAKSMVEACLECAAAGLKPDGKEAALVPFKGAVQFLPMVKGIINILGRAAGVIDIQADVVYKGEHFIYMQGTNPKLEHSFGLEERSGRDEDIIGAYAVIRTKDGGYYQRAISRKHIDKVRAAARASKGPWVDWFSEMAKKTALKNCAKLLPLTFEVAELLDRDNFLYDMTPKETIKPAVLAADPRDRIEGPKDHEPPADPAPPPAATQARQEPDKNNPPRTEPKKEERAPDDRPEPPMENEAPAGPQDDDGFPGDRKVSDEPAEQTDAMPGLIVKAIKAMWDLDEWEQLEALMYQIWADSRWQAAFDGGHHKGFYELIKTGKLWQHAPATSEVYQRIREGN